MRRKQKQAIKKGGILLASAIGGVLAVLAIVKAVKRLEGTGATAASGGECRSLWLRFRRPGATRKSQEAGEARRDEPVESASEDSFPASDAPAWTGTAL